MTAKNTNQTFVEATYEVNPGKGEVKLVAVKKKENTKEVPVKTISSFAKNRRYSLNNNGGGYMGL